MCRPCARELRRLENMTVAPLCGVYTEAYAGGVVARSLRVTGLLVARLDAALQAHITARLLSRALSQWLAVRLQLFSGALIAALAALAVGNSSWTPAGALPPRPPPMPTTAPVWRM